MVKNVQIMALKQDFPNQRGMSQSHIHHLYTGYGDNTDKAARFTTKVFRVYSCKSKELIQRRSAHLLTLTI